MSPKILLAMGITAGAFGILTSLLCLSTMFFQIRIGTYVKNHLSEEIKEIEPGLDFSSFYSPFHSNEKVLDKVQDKKLVQLRDIARKNKIYFLTSFCITAFLVLLTLGLGTVFSLQQE